MGEKFKSWLILLERDSCVSEDPALIRIGWEQYRTRGSEFASGCNLQKV